MKADRIKRGIAIVLVILLVSTCVAVDYRREADYKRVIYHYQDILDEVGDEREHLDYIHRIVGDPYEDWYYDIPRYTMFWDERRKR